MIVREESIPKANIYSSKLLFDQVENRNKKRMVQMMKRKTALSAKNKSTKIKYQDSSPKESPIRPKIEDFNKDLLILNLFKERELDINNIINQNQLSDIKTDSEPEKEIISNNNNNLNNNNNIKLDCSSVVSNIVNENNNYYNNSSTNNSNNNSILYKDSQEKEINISNLDNESIDEIILNKDNNIINNQEDEENNHKPRANNLYDYDNDDVNFITKEENKIKEENEYALKYLSSSSDSFVQLDNNLVARAKAQGGDMTESYLQALFPQSTFDTNKSSKNKNYGVNDTINEEIETETPLRIKNDNFKHSKSISKSSRVSIDLNLNSNKNKNDSIIKVIKKSPKRKNNFNIYKKNNISKINENNKNSLKEKKYKSNLNLVNKKKFIKKNNTMSKFTLDKKNLNLNSLSFLFNIKDINNISNNIYNKSILCSSVSSNLYYKTKKEFKLNKNIKQKINLRKSFNSVDINRKENLSNDTLILNYIKSVHVNKERNYKLAKINNHYLKNFNNYENYKTSNINVKNLVKKNQDECNINKLNLETTNTYNNFNTINSSKEICFYNEVFSSYNNSIDLSKRKNILSSRNKPKRYLNNNSLKKNNSKNDLSKNNKKEIFSKFKSLNTNDSFTKRKIKINHQPSHYIHLAKTNIKINPKLKKNLTKNNRVKSLSKIIFKKPEINLMYKSCHNLKRSKTTNNKKYNKLNLNESITISSSYIKNVKKTNNFNNTFNKTYSNIPLKKRKFTPFHKKIDYSYVKPKVKTGLSEIMVERLLKTNHKLANKQTNKKIEIDKKKSILKRCKISMNKTIDNFREMASCIKKRLFKKNRDKLDNEKINNFIHSCRNNRKTISNND